MVSQHLQSRLFVGVQLGFQSLNAVEFLFVTDFFYEENRNILPVNIGIKVKNIHFDGPVGAVNGGADTDVHHAAVQLVIGQHLYGIHTVGRNEFVGFGRVNVGRGIANGAPQLIALNHHAR